LLLTWTLIALAEDNVAVFSPELQLRPRLEADSGRDGVPEAGDVSFITMRSRLGATLSNRDVAGRIVISDVRAFGEELHTRRDFDADGLDVRIASLTWNVGDAFVEVGRMERGLHAERLMAIANWRQPGRSFDGLRVGWGSGDWVVEGRALLLSERDQLDFATTDQVLPGGKDGGLLLFSGGYEQANGLLQPVLMVERDGDAELTRVTSGLFTEGARGTVHARFETYLQLGRRVGDSVSAGMVAARLWYAPASKRGTLGAAYDLLSGDADAADGAQHSFDAPYGANHRYYGHLDMLTFVEGAWKDGQGLHDAQVFGTWSPNKRLTASLDLHTFLAVVPLDGALLAIEPDFAVNVGLAEGLGWSNGVNLWLDPTPEGTEWMAYSMLDLRL
jgi:hypothetical protein